MTMPPPPDFPLPGARPQSVGAPPAQVPQGAAAPPPAPSQELASYSNVSNLAFDPRTGVRLDRAFPGIDAHTFRDGRDAERLARVRLLKGLDFVYGRFLNLGVEQAMALEMAAQAVQLGPTQGSSLWALLDRACRVLDIRVPDLFLGHIDASMQTVGHLRPFIVADVGIVDLLTDDELVFAFGRELGHVLLGHVTYKMLARSIGAIGDTIGTFTLNVGSMVTTGLEAPLRDWDQFSEFSADRAGLLAVQRLDVAVMALMKLAGGGQRFFEELSPEAFVAQGRLALSEERPAGTRISAIVRSLQAGAALFATRAAALTEWHQSGEYAAVLQGQYTYRQ